MNINQMCDEKKMHTQRKTGDGGTEKKNVQQCKQTTSNWIITCTNKLDDSKLSTQIEFRLSDQPKLASQPSGDIVYMSIHDFVNLFILTHFNSGLTTLFISLCSYRCCCCYYFVFLIIFGRHKQLHTCMCASIYVSIGRKTVLFIRLRLAVNHSNNATKTYILNRCQRHTETQNRHWHKMHANNWINRNSSFLGVYLFTKTKNSCNCEEARSLLL